MAFAARFVLRPDFEVTLRRRRSALLSDDMERYEQLFGQLDRAQARSGYTASFRD